MRSIDSMVRVRRDRAQRSPEPEPHQLEEVDKGGHFAAWEQPQSKPVRARERRVVSAFSNGSPTPEDQGAVSRGAESSRGVHRPRRRSVNELDRGNHFATWQETDLFTTEIRAAFRSLR